MYYIYTQTRKEIKGFSFGFLVMHPVFFFFFYCKEKPFVDSACSLLRRIFLFDEKSEDESGY